MLVQFIYSLKMSENDILLDDVIKEMLPICIRSQWAKTYFGPYPYQENELHIITNFFPI